MRISDWSSDVCSSDLSGVIINPTDREQRVPPILAELRDAQGTIVYSWTIKPPVRMLPPNEKVNFSEAKLDIPRRATQLTVSWAQPTGKPACDVTPSQADGGGQQIGREHV